MMQQVKARQQRQQHSQQRQSIHNPLLRSSRSTCVLLRVATALDQQQREMVPGPRQVIQSPEVLLACLVAPLLMESLQQAVQEMQEALSDHPQQQQQQQQQCDVISPTSSGSHQLDRQGSVLGGRRGSVAVDLLVVDDSLLRQHGSSSSSSQRYMLQALPAAASHPLAHQTAAGAGVAALRGISSGASNFSSDSSTDGSSTDGSSPSSSMPCSRRDGRGLATAARCGTPGGFAAARS